MLRNHLFILTVAIKSIPYNIKYPFFLKKKSFKYIRLWLPKCHFIHKAANTIYSSYIIFFSHKIHFIKFYLYLVYYWSMELRVIAEGLPSFVNILHTQQSQRAVPGWPTPLKSIPTLQSIGWRHKGDNIKAASALFKNPYLPSSCRWR